MKNLIRTVLFLGLIACSTKRSDLKDEEFAHLLNIDLEDANDKMSESDFLSRVDYIPLKGTLMGEINKILFHHDRIYMGDHLQDKIMWFDMQGNFINMIDSVGRGPGEYLEYVDFTIDTDNDLLIVSDDFRYHVYDLDGTFKKRYNAPTQALRFEYFSGGYLLDTGMDADPSADIDGQLTSTILLDANFMVQSGYFHFDQDLSPLEYPKSNQYFTIQGKPIINKLFSNDYFVLEKDFKPTPAYRFNFGSKNIPQSIYHPDSYFEIRNTIQKYGLVGDVLICANFALGYILYNDDTYLSVFDTKTSHCKISLTKNIEMDISNFPVWNPYIANDPQGNLVSIHYPLDLDEESNPVVVINYPR